MSAIANLLGTGMSVYWSKYLDLTGFQVQWWDRTWSGNLSGYEDTTQQFSGSVTLTVRKARPQMTDELVDNKAGYLADETWTLLYPASAAVRYRDFIATSTGEGYAVYMVTTPTAAPWGNVEVIKKARVRRLVNVSGGGQPNITSWPTG